MNDTPDTAVEITDLKVSNSLLRGSLFLTTRALKDYHDANHVPMKNPDMLRLTVPASYRERAADALVRADILLKDQGR